MYKYKEHNQEDLMSSVTNEHPQIKKMSRGLLDNYHHNCTTSIKNEQYISCLFSLLSSATVTFRRGNKCL